MKVAPLAGCPSKQPRLATIFQKQNGLAVKSENLEKVYLIENNTFSSLLVPDG
jgi:hypothetical protein